MECTKSQLLKLSHAVARHIAATTGVSYREAMSQGMQTAWASAKAPRDTHTAQSLCKAFIAHLPSRMMQFKKKSANPVTGAVIVTFARVGSKEEFVFSYNGVVSFFTAHEAGNPANVTREKFVFDAQKDMYAIFNALIDFLA